MNDPRERLSHITRLMKEHYGLDSQSSVESLDPFRTLISCMLSHRTRDENSSRAAERLFEAAETPGDILQMDADELKERIRCSGFYNQKSRNIRAACRSLLEEFEGLVPGDREALMSLPGVGPKTADIVLSYSFGRQAIAVDVHVATVTRRLGFVDPGASPEEVKESLEGLAPMENYRMIDVAFVRHGKEYCRSRNPRCGECFVKAVCPYPEAQSR